MIYLIPIYLILYEIEIFFQFQPLLVIGDLKISNSFIFIIFFNIYSLFCLVKSNNFNFVKSPIFRYYILLLFSLVPVLLYRFSFFIGGLSIFVQLLSQTTFLFLLPHILYNESITNRFISLMWFYATINALIAYGSFFLPELFVNISEIQGYFGYDTTTPTDSNVFKRAFGIIGDTGPWFFTFYAIYAFIKKKYLYFIFFSGTIFIGVSVGASISLLAALLIYFISKNGKKGLLFLFFFFVIVFSLYFIFPDYFNEISLIRRITLENFDDGTSSAQRLFSYSVAVDLISQKVLFGWGFGTFFYTVQVFSSTKIYSLAMDVGSALSNTNNQYLQVFFEVGFLGFLFFVHMLFNLLQRIRPKPHAEYILPKKLSSFSYAAFFWFFALILTNHTAVWMIPGLFYTNIIIIIATSISINRL